MSANPHSIPFDTRQEIIDGNGGGLKQGPVEVIPEQTNGHPKTVAQAVAEAGVDSLKADSTPEEIITAIHKFVAISANKDAVWLGIAKSELVKRLKAAKVQGATELIKSAFNKNETSPNNVNGQEIQFEDPEPWPDPVDGGHLLNEIVETLSRFVVLPKWAAETISLWILHAWALDAFYLSPILRITSPTRGCGKSTLLILTGHLMPRNFVSANLTTATMFRLNDKYGISLCIDEADQAFKSNEELVSLVNSGYLRKAALVPRCEGPSNEVKLFNSWGPKLIAGIGRLPETTESRCLTTRLEKKTDAEKVERLPYHKLGDFDHIRQKCQRWAQDNIYLLKDQDPEIPESLGDRPSDNWRPLLAVADLCGDEWSEKARKASLVISGQDNLEDDSVNVQLLCDIWKIFQETGEDRLSSTRILSGLHVMEERLWPDWYGRPISASSVAKILKPFGIIPKQFRDSGRKERGYIKTFFISPVSRYQTGTPGIPLNNSALINSQPGTNTPIVPALNSDNRFNNNDVPGVPAITPLLGEKIKIIVKSADGVVERHRI